ncbi:hypothetical protein O6H91_Y144500 [Diphasiastrum complanatum]|nr:hypothetical protein O6H91_Y144500 [Diphasiastrum complanatum]
MYGHMNFIKEALAPLLFFAFQAAIKSETDRQRERAMDDDDEWQLSAEQLDALERDAKTQLAQRQRFPFSNTVSSALPLPSSSSSSSYSTMNLCQSSASSFFASSASNQLHSSPVKRCSVAAPQNSPYKPASFTSDFLQSSPLKRSSAVAFQVASPLRSSESPGKVFADRGGGMTPPLKNSDKAVPFKVFLDRPGSVAVETYYNQQLVAAFKSIRGHEWDHKRKLWVFPEHHFEDICKAAALCLPVHMEIDVVPPLSIPPDFLKLCKSSAMNITSPLDPSKSESCEPSSSQQSEENNTQDAANPFKPKRSLFFVVQVFLKDDDHIATRSPYHENIKRACQSVAGRSWNPVEK